MSDVKLTDLLSNGDNESIREFVDTFSTNEEAISKISFVDNSKIPSSIIPLWMNGGRNTQLDVDYAIELLKREDQNISVYYHLQGIIDKMLLERPENPLECFESYSQILKRSYILRENNFEPIFVDNINRDDCCKNLQMYKCAMKIQSENQKQYSKNNTSVKKSDILSSKEKKIMNDSDNFEVHVQNLWEVNYMFNKAGCGLPMNEVALISMAMNTMARLNQFKNIRFWGKIFGTKKTYFIVECEWTDVELYRKILMKKNKPELSSLHDEKELNNEVSNNHVIKQFFKSTLDFSSFIKKNETKSKETSQQESFNSTIKTENSEVVDGLIVSDNLETNETDSLNNDSWTSIDASYSFKTKLETSSLKIPDEMFGTGANKNVYFVTNDLNTKWIELDLVHSNHIAEARKIKRCFTGKLYEPINSFPKFNGLEIDYLRAQIARISASTQICPQGYYVIDKKEINTVVLDNQPSVSSDLTKIIHFDLIQIKNVKPIPNNNLIHSNYWVHKNSPIQDSRNTNNSDFSVPHHSITNEELSFITEEEYLNSTEESINHKKESFGNLKNDVNINNSPAWKGGLCSPFDSRYSCTVMKSLIWPGAYAVVNKLETDYVYIGWAQKNDSIEYCSNLIGELRIVNFANENPIVYQEYIEGRKTTKSKKNIFPSKKYRKVYKGGEKVIKNYNYEF